MQPTKDQMLWMFEQMLVIREFEETMVTIYLEGKLPPDIQDGLAFDIGAGPVPGEMHLAAGQEPVAVGTCAHLKKEDTVTGTHRPHHFAIAKGVPLNPLAAEIFGKVTGLGRGKGGHMHDASGDSCVSHFMNFVAGQTQWFFAHDMFAVSGGCDGHIFMCKIWRGNNDCINVRVGAQRFVIGGCLFDAPVTLSLLK